MANEPQLFGLVSENLRLRLIMSETINLDRHSADWNSHVYAHVRSSQPPFQLGVNTFGLERIIQLELGGREAHV